MDTDADDLPDVPDEIRAQAREVQDLLAAKSKDAGPALKRLLASIQGDAPAGSKKPMGGAEKLRIKRAAAERERQRDEEGQGGTFDRLGPAPIDSTAELVTWGAQALALVVDRAMRRRDIFETEFDQLRFVADSCAKLGLVRDKAAEQESIKKLLKATTQEKETAGLTDAGGRSTPRVSRPPG